MTVVVTPALDTIAPGGNLQLAATLRDAGGTALSGRTITWSSTNTAAATVSTTGVVTGVADGTTTITASSEGKNGNAAIVVHIKVASVTVSPSLDTIVPSGSIQLNATVMDGSGNQLTGRLVTWTSSNPNTATVTPGGLVTGNVEGSTTITANSEGTVGAAQVVVRIPIASVTISDATPTILLGKAIPLIALAKDANGTAIPGRTFTWATSDTLIARVSSAGLATGEGLGTATITAKSDGVTGEALITIIPTPTGTLTSLKAAVLFSVCAVNTAGSAFCWGFNLSGSVGDGTTSRTRSAPVTVVFSSSFKQVASSSTHSCGISTTDAGYCWGGVADLGALGDGSATEKLTPVAVSGGLVFSSVGVGQQQSCGLTTAGAAYCWGSNGSGNLGNGSTSQSNTPSAVSGGRVFTSLTVGFRHACGLIANGTAFCWGDNRNGALGDGTTTTPTVPVQVSGGLSFASINAGEHVTCGTTTTAESYCWGLNDAGQLGDGTTTQRLTPVLVTGGIAFTVVRPSLDLTCGVSTAGAAYCWGANARGGTGDGTNTPSAVPVAVSGGHVFADVSTSYQGACGLRTDGRAYCWGRNDFGQLGVGNLTDSNVPVRVAGQP